MAFKTGKKIVFSYQTPQEMYQDNKTKKIMGPLDYQSNMLELYMKNYDKTNISLELPTGSGKTLIGLLIGEFRRRKNKERVLFLCPTNQLVNQVAEQANSKYGIKAIPFTGKQAEYNPKDKTNFELAEKIGVTTYSSFFADNSYFNDIDVLIMDDVHSCEDYIISNWSLKITKEDETLFDCVKEWLKPYISENDTFFLDNNEIDTSADSWCSIVPMPLIIENLNELNRILNEGILERSPNYYAYKKIREHLDACNIFLSNKKILIRPWIAPTKTIQSFSKCKQRILMSATLGNNGELERITGLDNILRLPLVDNWEKRGLGRRFFTFPDLSIPELQSDVIINLQKLCKKSVFLVPDKNTLNEIKNFYNQHMPDVEVFEAEDIEISKENFLEAEQATVILANRFDGLDFPDEESRLLFIYNLPKTTNIQEKFIINKMAASKLYHERIKTRIIQAVGRCSRNASDYSIVCVFGNSINEYLTKKEKFELFPPELRAELKFGIDNSTDYNNINDVLEQANDFFHKTPAWDDAEIEIVKSRNCYLSESDNSKEDSEKEINKKLSKSAKFELNYQYALWSANFDSAYASAIKIVQELNAPSLGGYKFFWNYLAGMASYRLYKAGKEEYKNKSIEHFKIPSNGSINSKWMSNLNASLFKESPQQTDMDDLFFENIDRIEEKLSSFNTASKLENEIHSILTDLKSGGTNFERGHEKLGALLGYISRNSDGTAHPDPRWIINENYIIVSEDKIYNEENNSVKSIPVNDIREAASHETWVKEYERGINKNAKIFSIFVTNSKSISDEARIYANNIYYIERDRFYEWALAATRVVRDIYNSFSGNGDENWRNSAHNAFIDNKITPKDFINFLTKQSLKSL